MKRFLAAALLLLFALSAMGRGWPQVQRLINDPSERRAVLRTIELIEVGGPFPYSRDGIVFFNREGRLPRYQRGYYREYTVPTREARDRGARRIIRGSRGETYYTRDHYGTFVRLD